MRPCNDKEKAESSDQTVHWVVNHESIILKHTLIQSTDPTIPATVSPIYQKPAALNAKLSRSPLNRVDGQKFGLSVNQSLSSMMTQITTQMTL
jgi:hypothetical protein